MLQMPLSRRQRRLRPPATLSNCSWLYHHLDAIVSFLAKHLISRWGLIQRHRVADNERRIDVAATDPLQQRTHIFMYMCLPHPEGEAFCEGGANRKFVDQTAIDAGYGNRSTFAARVNGLAQRQRP